MLRNSLLALAVAAFAALPVVASAQYNGDTLLPSQTVITGTLEQSINSKTAQVGDPFVLDVTQPYPGDDQRFGGAKVYGHVASVQRANNTKGGGVNLAFDRLTLMDGTTASLTGQLAVARRQAQRQHGRAHHRRRGHRPDHRQLHRQAHRHRRRRRGRRDRRRHLRRQPGHERHRRPGHDRRAQDDDPGDDPVAPSSRLSERQRLQQQSGRSVPDPISDALPLVSARDIASAVSLS